MEIVRRVRLHPTRREDWERAIAAQTQLGAEKAAAAKAAEALTAEQQELRRSLEAKQPGTFRVAGTVRPRAFPRYILTAEFFETFDRLRNAMSGEKDDVPVLRHLATRGHLAGASVEGIFHDAGNPIGLSAAEQAWSAR